MPHRARLLSAFVAIVVLGGCSDKELSPPDPVYWQIAPGSWTSVVPGVPADSEVAVGANGIAFASYVGDRDPLRFRIQYWEEGEPAVFDVTEIQGMLVGITMIGDVIHVAYVPQRGQATFWRMDVTSGVASTDPVRFDDRGRSSIRNQAAAFHVGQQMFLFGGCCQERAVYVYDTETFEYHRVGDMPGTEPHNERVVVAANGREILVSLWPTREEPTARLYNFDPISGRWTHLGTTRGGGFPLAAAGNVWFVQDTAVSKVHPNATVEKHPGILGLDLGDGRVRRVTVSASASDGEQLVAVAIEGGVYRWTPPDEHAWGVPRYIEPRHIEYG